MSWLAAIALAIASFAVAALLFRIEKGLWTSLAAALAFGLAGYAVQASPDVPSAPTTRAAEATGDRMDVVTARQEFIGDRDRSSANLMITADAVARRGRFIDASVYLAGITKQNPQDFEAWLAHGIVLAEHADGALTAPALYAYQQATRIKPDHPGPGYFLGVSLIRQGRMMEARQVWRETLANAPDDAPGREGLALRLQRLDAMLGAMQGSERGTSVPAPGQQ